MKIDSTTISQILSSMKDYNPVADELVGKVAQALIPVALVILAILMYLELSNANRLLAHEQGKMNTTIFMLVAWKYFVAFALVMTSSQIIDAIVWINSAIGWIIDKIITSDSSISMVIPEISGKLNIFQKGLIYGLQAVANFFVWTSEIVVKILIFMRFFSLYVYKAAAPVLMSTYISDEWKNISTTYIRGFIALIIQGFVLVIIMKLYPAIVTNDMFSLVAEGTFTQNLAALFIVLGKAILYIIVLIGSQNLVKRWMGA